MKRVVKIGTRGSLLALAQAEHVQKKLLEGGTESQLVVINTSGDRFQDKRLADIGGKALFTKEIERSLLQGHIDMAVHSMKDVETRRPVGLRIAAILKRSDPRDAFLSSLYPTLESLVPGVRVGTCSPRRAAQVLAYQPKADIVLFRGNIHTRLKKLKKGEVDVTFLALAGLKRVFLEQEVTQVLDPEIMLPAAGQGAIGVECLTSREDLTPLLSPLSDVQTEQCLGIERCFLSFLEGDCHTPVGALAIEEDKNRFFLRTFVSSEDGRRLMKKQLRGSYSDLMKEAEVLGKEAREWFLS